MTFYPPFIILLLFVTLSIFNGDVFISLMENMNDWIIRNFGWCASLIALFVTFLGIIAANSSFGEVRIGGPNAKPKLSNTTWFSITLTTTLAAGILFWGPGEPMAHYTSPPTELYGIVGETPESLKFAMEMMFLHWTIVPYAIYTIPSLVFAFMFYNARKPFTIAGEIAPFVGKNAYKPQIMEFIDAITLFSITAGMTSSVAQALLNISGGIAKLTPMESSPTLWFWVAIIVGATVSATSISGLENGMKKIATINVYGFILFLIFLMIFSNPTFLINLATDALGGFLDTFFLRLLSTGEYAQSDWPNQWTTYYWFTWMAWAPTTGAFLGQIAYGRKIKHIIALYMGICAFMSMTWMIFVSGTALWMHTSGKVDLVASYTRGVEHVPYDMLEAMPFGQMIIPLFVILIFLSIVTACNSTILTMASLSTKGIDLENPDAPNSLKLIWGISILAFSYVLISMIGINGLKIIANIGGMFAAVIMVGATLSFFILIGSYDKFDATTENFEDTFL